MRFFCLQYRSSDKVVKNKTKDFSESLSCPARLAFTPREHLALGDFQILFQNTFHIEKMG